MAEHSLKNSNFWAAGNQLSTLVPTEPKLVENGVEDTGRWSSSTMEERVKFSLSPPPTHPLYWVGLHGDNASDSQSRSNGTEFWTKTAYSD